MVQVKFSEGARNACPELSGLLRRLLRQPWDDGGRWQLGGEVI